MNDRFTGHAILPDELLYYFQRIVGGVVLCILADVDRTGFPKLYQTRLGALLKCMSTWIRLKKIATRHQIHHQNRV